MARISSESKGLSSFIVFLLSLDPGCPKKAAQKRQRVIIMIRFMTLAFFSPPPVDATDFRQF